jgi:hypothetical protein
MRARGFWTLGVVFGVGLLAGPAARAELPCDTPCPRPLSIPDRWEDANENARFDPGDPYEDLNGNAAWDPGEPYTDSDGDMAYTPPEFYDPTLTGYGPQDVGSQLVIKVGNPQQDPAPGRYWPVSFPPLGGASPPVTGNDAVESHLTGCADVELAAGDTLLIEPGNVVAIFLNAFQSYVAGDPDAYWDPTAPGVVGSAFPAGRSPRYLRVTLFKPPSVGSQRNTICVAREAILFLESTASNEALVRFVCLEPTTPAPVQTLRWGQLKARY